MFREPPPLVPDDDSSTTSSTVKCTKKLKIYLRDLEKDMIDSWNVVFHDPRLAILAEAHGYELDFDIKKGDITEIEDQVDVLVSPANGSGNMNGGIDGFYLQKFGRRLETDVIEQIRKRHHGLLPVGKSVIISMRRYSDKFRFLISSPTMLLPGKPVEPLSTFLAFKSTLETIQAFNEKSKLPITSLACPGLGTGVGEVPFFRSALQMRAAIDSWFGCAFSNRAFKEQREYYVFLTTIKKPFSITTLYTP
jgi:O-acetyl-ADP-ribose deacetylase (regulator of RNase III)